MPLRTDAYYRGVAEQAIARLGVVDPPVSVEGIAALYGIPIIPVNLPAFFTAATVYHDGLPSFVVNWARPETERREAIAHMLGHVLIVLSDRGDTFPRDQRTHDDADAVALEILLPSTMVIDQARLWFNDHRYLSRLFGVAEDRMLERMRDLGIIKGPDGLMWDY